MARVILHEMSADEEMREIARLREKAILDERSAMNFARREGIEEGIGIGMEKGRAEGRVEEREAIIARMREDGLTKEQIQRYIK